MSLYYLDGPSLSSATAVFTDPDLTICALDGFYSEGSIVREQIDCVLLPQRICPSCGAPCNREYNALEITSDESIFYLDIDTGSSSTSIGAIILTLKVPGYAEGVTATYNGNIYNKFSSPVLGYLAGPAGLPTFVGTDFSGCPYTTTSWNLEVYNHNASTGVWDDMGYTESVVINASQLQGVGGTDPGSMVMIIPKPTPAPANIRLKFIVCCKNPSFDVINISCPKILPTFVASETNSSAEFACDSTIEVGYYSAPVNGNGVTLGMYDWVFFDPIGQNVLPNGYYKSPNLLTPYNWFRVANGIIVEFGTC
jgi:hypothetical protein